MAVLHDGRELRRGSLFNGYVLSRLMYDAAGFHAYLLTSAFTECGRLFVPWTSVTYLYDFR